MTDEVDFLTAARAVRPRHAHPSGVGDPMPTRLHSQRGRTCVQECDDGAPGSGVRPTADCAPGSVDASAIAVHALGAFRVFRDGTEVPPREWQSKKARDMLKMLIAHRGRPVSRQRLIELLWPDQSPERTGNRLSVLLCIVRRVLDPHRRIIQPGPIVADRSAVRLDRNVVDVDVEHFLSAADTARHAADVDDRAAATLLRAASDLYAGDFLDDDPYEDWAQPLHDEARAAYAGVLRALATHSADVDGKVLSLVRLIHREPYEEEAHLDLVRVLREAGRHGQAQRHYRTYAERMTELGVEPVAPHRLQLTASASRLVG